MMEEMTMSLNRLVLAIALIGAACPALAVPLAMCPQQHGEGKHTGFLGNASVFDGAPEKLVELMPDLATLEWDLSTGQEYARAGGNSMYLVCKYKGIKSTVTLKIPYQATLCKVEGIRQRTSRTSIWCGKRRNNSAINPR